jgi:predicted P-loop ATPase
MQSEEIRKTLQTLFDDDDIFEIRIPKTDDYKLGVVSGYYDMKNIDSMMKHFAEFDGKYNVYITLQRIKKSLLARGKNKLRKKATDTTKDSDVDHYRWLLIDLDPSRPSGISSSGEEKEFAFLKACEIFDFLKQKWGVDPIFADSGNGYHLLYKIDLENDKKGQNKGLIERALKGLGGIYTDENVGVDETVFNPARITKLYGTIATKGDHTEDRPHRKSGFFRAPDEILTVSREQLEEIAIKKEQSKQIPQQIKSNFKSNNDSFDLNNFIVKYGIQVKEVKVEGGREKHVLNVCPFNSSHINKSAITKDTDGVLGFKCLSESCSGNGWKDLRRLYDPEYETKRTEHKNTVDQSPSNPIFDEKFCSVKYNEKTKQKTIKIKPMQENVFAIMEHYQTTSKYNEMTKETEVLIEGKSFSADNSSELSLRYIHNKCIHHDFHAPIDLVDSSFLAQGEINKYNPAKVYLEKQYNIYKNESLSELSEFQKLLGTLKTPDTFNLEYKERLIRKWLISCVVAVCGEQGIKSQGVLVLQGKQGLMKTTWLKKLIPNEKWFNEGESLDPAQKDSVLGVIKYWVVELGEIESTFKKDLERLKAFISKDFDEVRRPYARTTSKYPRRTVFCGSVNGDEFLKDPTGNRRWWVIPCDDIVFDETLDLNKLWAEMYQLYLNGTSYYLSKKQIEEMADINAQFEVKDKAYTLIECSFDWESHQRYWVSTRDIFNMLPDTKNITPKKISQVLKKLKAPERTSRGITQYAIPKAINTYEWRHKEAPDDISVVFR